MKYTDVEMTGSLRLLVSYVIALAVRPRADSQGVFVSHRVHK